MVEECFLWQDGDAQMRLGARTGMDAAWVAVCMRSWSERWRWWLVVTEWSWGGSCVQMFFVCAGAGAGVEDSNDVRA